MGNMVYGICNTKGFTRTSSISRDVLSNPSFKVNRNYLLDEKTDFI